MISMKTLMVRGAVGLGAVLTLLPAASLAATPQQIIDKGLSEMTLTQASQNTGEIKVTLSERNANSRKANSSVVITFGVTERKLPLASGQVVPDSEGTLVVKNVEGTGAYAVPKLSNVGTIEWRIKDGVGYVRVKELSDIVSLFLQAKGIDAKSAVGTWVKIDAVEICSLIGTTCSLATNAATLSVANSGNLAAQKPVRVTRVEKYWTAKNGDKMVRVRGILNPSLVTKLEQQEIAKIAKNDPARAKKIAAIRAQYQEARKTLAKTQFAININQTKSTVDRIEGGTAQETAAKNCTMNAAKRQVCKVTGYTTVSVLSGMNLSGAKTAPVLAPESSVSAASLATPALQIIQNLK